jgi:glycine/D-amino acid oxidase-like deaminating enzyme
MADLPKRAQVIIVGGGIVGCSVAYHLTRRGCTDVLLLEKPQPPTVENLAGLLQQIKSKE